MRSKILLIICFLFGLVLFSSVSSGAGVYFGSSALNPDHCIVVGDTVRAKVGVELTFPIQYEPVIEDDNGVLGFKEGSVNVLEVRRPGETEVRLRTIHDRVGLIFKVIAWK